ncbi:MAG: twin-arginine translocase subunit TatC [Pseudomonadota bacterium]
MSAEEAGAIVPKTDELDEVEASRAPLESHLKELRTRLMRAMIAVALCAVGGFFISEYLLDLLLVPFSEAAMAGGRSAEEVEVIFTSALEVLFIKLRLAVLVGIAVSFPYVAWEVYSFVAPGLYKNERGAIIPYLVATPFLFAAGLALVYFIVLPFVMRFAFSQEFAGMAAEVTFLPKANEYVSLALRLLTAFGMAFQLPIVLSLLAQAGIVSSAGLRSGRKYAIVGIFAMAMLMTPPDPFSQTALALPVYLLFEAGVIAAWLIERGRKKREAEAAAEP